MTLSSSRKSSSGLSSRAHVAAGSILQIGSTFAILGCGLLLMGYLTRRLGLADYGRYALSVLLLNWINAMIMRFSTGGALVRLIAGHADGQKHAVSMLQLVALISGGVSLLLFLGAGVIATLLRSPGIAVLLRILSLNLPLACLAAVHLSVLTAQGKFGKSALGNLSGWVFQLMAAVVFLECGLATRGAAWAVTASGAAQFLLVRVMSGVPLFSRHRVPFSQLWIKTRLLAGAEVVLRISQSMDLLAVKYFLGMASLAGLYAGMQNIGVASMMLFQPTNSVVLQSLSKSLHQENHQDAAHIATSYLRLALIYGGVLVALGMFSTEIAVFLLGTKFEAGGPVLAVMLLTAAFSFQSVVGRTFIAAAGEKAAILLPLLGIVIAGGAGYALIIPRFGILGGAGVAALIFLGIALISLREGLNVMKIRYPWRTLTRVLIASAATAGFAFWLRSFGFHVLANLLLTTGFYTVMLILLREWIPRTSHLERIFSIGRKLVGLP